MDNTTHLPLTSWLEENGPRQLEALLRSILFHPSSAIFIADDEHDASTGAARSLGHGRQQIIGRRPEDFAIPACGDSLPERSQECRLDGTQVATLHLLGPGGTAREVGHSATMSLQSDRDVPPRDQAGPGHKRSLSPLETWVEDYALMLLDASGRIFSFNAGAERMYGYHRDEVIGQNHSRLYLQSGGLHDDAKGKLNRATDNGHVGSESWHLRKDGSRFWANVITMALRDEVGVLQGFASVIRDFSDRRARDEKLERQRPPRLAINDQPSVVGVICGEFNKIVEINDALLEMVGYDREDLASGRLRWPNLTPNEFADKEALSHEQTLQFGASSPIEKELLHKDGTRIPVLVATAVLKLVPYRWIAFVTDLRNTNALEGVVAHASTQPVEFANIIGKSKELQLSLAQVEVVAPTDATVLILGETGTGKELIARAIHQLSSRRSFPFVTLNCAAIPAGLLESELFGYERGAFTGALQKKMGRFEAANRGTLFLDEIGDIPLELQPKLLRALQEKSLERLGSTQTTSIDIRLVAATNRNLKQMMMDNLFRGDLYYRLQVFPINLPPLRDRPDDIPLLVQHFMKKYSNKMGRNVDRVSPATMSQLCRWGWPGNIRELENFIEKSVILSPGSTLCAPISELIADTEMSGNSSLAPHSSALEDVERAHILRVLGETDGVVSAAAKRLRIPRTTLNAMMKRLKISDRKTYIATAV